MTVQEKYRRSSEIVASYDWQDIETGTGMVQFQGASCQPPTTREYILTEYPLFSDSIYTGSSVTLTFSGSQINSPRIIDGTAYLEFSWYVTTGSSASYYPLVTIYKSDGVTDEELAVASSAVLSRGSAGTNYNTTLIKLDIPTTVFENGDFFKVKIETTGSGGSTGIAHDPQDRDGVTFFTAGTVGTTQLNFYCPFKIDP